MSTNLPCPWLELARTDLGERRWDGAKHNPKILEYYATCGHPEVEADEVSFCAAGVGTWLTRAGYPIPPTSTNLLARSYITYGIGLDEPEIGCIGIWPRGAAWQGHVGIVAEILPGGAKVKLLGANQGAKHEVSYATYKTADALAFRRPVKATVADLRQAGSTDIQLGDRLQKASVAMSLITGAAATADTVVSPAEVAAPAVDLMKDAVEHLDLTGKLIQGAANVANLVGKHPYIIGMAVAVIALALLGRQIKQHRVKRAQAGHDLSGQVSTPTGKA